MTSEDQETILITIDQLQQTLEVMSASLNRLKHQLSPDALQQTQPTPSDSEEAPCLH